MAEKDAIGDQIPEPWATDQWDFNFNDDLRQRILRDPDYGLWLTKAFQVHATRLKARRLMHPEVAWPLNDMNRLARHLSVVAWWFDVAVRIDPSALRRLQDATVDIYSFGDTSNAAIRKWMNAMHECYGLYDRARVLIESGHVVAEPTEPPRKERTSANTLMIERLSKDPASRDWTLEQWSNAISRSKSTIQQTAIWKEIMAQRAAQKDDRKSRSITPYDD